MVKNVNAQRSREVAMNWQIIDSLPNIGVAGALAGVHNEVLIVAGGANFPDKMPWDGGKKQYHNDIYVFKKDKNGHVKRLKNTFKLSENIAYSASVSTEKGIVCIGGENENGITNKVFFMRWDAATQEIIIEFLPSLPIQLTNSAAILRGGILYVAGGESSSNSTSDSFFSLNLSSSEKTWKKLPALPKPTSHCVMVAQNNSLYIIGGRAKTQTGISDLYKTVFVFDFTNKQWIEKEPLPYPLSAGTGIAFKNNEIILFGGDKGETFHQVEMLLAAINSEPNTDKKTALTQQKNTLQLSHAGFSKTILKYNTLKNQWVEIGQIPYPSPVTTTIVKWGQQVIIPSGEIRAGVRTPQLLSVFIGLKKIENASNLKSKTNEAKQ